MTFMCIQTIAFINFILLGLIAAAALGLPLNNPKLPSLGARALKGSGIRGDQYRWPQRVIPYSIHPDIDNEDRLVILTAFAHIEKTTCISFVPRTFEKDHILVVYGDFQTPALGRRGGRQLVNVVRALVDNNSLMSVAHNFIHVIGFAHEHSRSDRDDFITINWGNILPGVEYNFDKYSDEEVESFGVPYDYGSIMHYAADAYAVAPDVVTIVVPEGVEIGQRRGMSPLDSEKINNMYGCVEGHRLGQRQQRSA